MLIQKTHSGKDLTHRSSVLTHGLESLVKGERKTSVHFCKKHSNVGQFSSVVYHSLRPHGLQHSRPP